jgi:hypothetical protein
MPPLPLLLGGDDGCHGSSGVAQLRRLEATVNAQFWIWAAVVFVIVGVLAVLIYKFVDPCCVCLHDALNSGKARMTKPDVQQQPEAPRAPPPAERHHWYLNDMLAVNDEDVSAQQARITFNWPHSHRAIGSLTDNGATLLSPAMISQIMELGPESLQQTATTTLGRKGPPGPHEQGHVHGGRKKKKKKSPNRTRV